MQVGQRFNAGNRAARCHPISSSCSLANPLFLCALSECVIIALIYIERLMETRSLVLTSRNWIPVVSTALLTASKVQDDHSSFNAEFAVILPIFTLQQINAMERVFLTTLSYELYISSSVYAQYYFGLRSLKAIRDPTNIPRYYHAVGKGESAAGLGAA
jgi:hypothetical protein